MAAYYDKKDTKLKWHRFTQIVIMPLSIIAAGFYVYLIGKLIIDLNTMGRMAVLLQYGIDIKSFTGFFLPVALVMAAIIGGWLLVLFAWTGSFRWHRYALVCWTGHLLLGFATALLIFYFLFSFNFVEILCFALAASGVTVNRTAVYVVMIVLFAFAVIYYVLSLVYYFKRRRLFLSTREYYRRMFEKPETPVADTPVNTEPVTGAPEKPAEEKAAKDTPPEETAEPAYVPPAKPEEEKSGDSEESEEEALEETAADDEETSYSKEGDTAQEDTSLPLEEAQTKPTPRHCVYCGAPIDKDDAVFCNHCGKRIPAGN